MLGLPGTVVSAFCLGVFLFGSFRYFGFVLVLVLFDYCAVNFVQVTTQEVSKVYPKLHSELCLQYLSLQRSTIRTTSQHAQNYCKTYHA